MSQRILLIVLGFAVVLGGGYFLLQSLGGNGSPTSVANAASLWVEVTSPQVSLVDPNGAVLQELNTGDEVKQGDTISSGATGKVVIHLPDGSTFRLEENSKLTLDKAEFGAQDESTSVEATLYNGRVWSKVVSLVTPQSEWQVKTSNAVATVRGTSFGVEYNNNKSRVLVSEHKVKVSVIDPATKKFVAGAERDVDAGKLLEIKNEDVPAFALKKANIPEPVAVTSSSPDVRDWNSRNEVADKEINDKVDAIKKEGLNDKEVRLIMREDTKKLEVKVKELRVKKEANDEINKEIKKSDIQEFKTRVKTRALELHGEKSGKNGRQSNGEEFTVPTPTDRDLSKPIKLELSGITEQKTVNDGDRIKMKAFLIYESGARRDVTEKVSWNITGDIGKVSDGVFVAKIPDRFSELPEVKGTLQAELKGDNISLSSSIITITVEQQAGDTIPIG